MRFLLCLILTLSVCWIGIQRASEYRKRPILMICLADSLAVLKNEVCVRRSPIPTALLRCSELFRDTKIFYQMLMVGTRSERPFSDVWDDAVKRICPYEDEAQHSLLALGEQIGRYDAQTQETAFAVCIDSLRSSAAQIRETTSHHARLAIGLGSACGLLLAVMCY